ncbi:MAG: Calpain family cysteine protease, partial [Bacillota bacterium]
MSRISILLALILLTSFNTKVDAKDPQPPPAASNSVTSTSQEQYGNPTLKELFDRQQQRNKNSKKYYLPAPSKKIWAKKVTAPIFKKEPTIDDIKQTDAGNCTIYSSIAAVVANDPARLKDIVFDDQQGHLYIKLQNAPVNLVNSPSLVRSPAESYRIYQVPKVLDKSEFKLGKETGQLYSTASAPWVNALEKAILHHSKLYAGPMEASSTVAGGCFGPYYLNTLLAPDLTAQAKQVHELPTEKHLIGLFGSFYPHPGLSKQHPGLVPGMHSYALLEKQSADRLLLFNPWEIGSTSTPVVDPYGNPVSTTHIGKRSFELIKDKRAHQAFWKKQQVEQAENEAWVPGNILVAEPTKDCPYDETFFSGSSYEETKLGFKPFTKAHELHDVRVKMWQQQAVNGTIGQGLLQKEKALTTEYAKWEKKRSKN